MRQLGRFLLCLALGLSCTGVVDTGADSRTDARPVDGALGPDATLPPGVDGAPPPHSEAGVPLPTTRKPRGVAGDEYADVVLGQPDFLQGIPGEIVKFKVAAPGGVVVDRHAHPNRVYIWDGQNSRILGFSSLGVCANDAGRRCTSDADCPGSTCALGVAGVNSTTFADLVLGQPGFDRSACNGDGAAEAFPDTVAPSASTLCSLRPGDPSPSEGGSFAGMAVDAAGNLFVPDIYNHRVLMYLDPFATDTAADAVFGQRSFDEGHCNADGAPSASTLCFDGPGYTAGVDIDANGNLWVADLGNHRVLRFPKSGSSLATSADLVLGQPDFSSRSSGSGLAALNGPTAVCAHPSGRIFVADGWNDRVLVYDPPLTSGKPGRVFVTGKYPTGVVLNPSGGVWVMDTLNYQVVLFDADSAAVKKVLLKDAYRPDGVCGGQPACSAPAGHDLCLMCDSRGSVGITSDEDVIIPASADTQDVHFYKHPIPAPTPGTPYPAAAELFAPPLRRNHVHDRGFHSPRGLALTADQLIVADAYRMLYWTLGAQGLASLTSGSAAAGIAGVTDFDQTVADPPFYRVAARGDTLWASRMRWLERYGLPLHHGQLANATYPTREIKLLGGAAIGRDIEIWGLVADPRGPYLWAALPYYDRVLRLRIPASSGEPFVADVILGGSDVPAERHDWHRPCPPSSELCAPGSVTLNRAGDVVVSNYNTENEGSGELLVFSASLFPASPGALLCVPATAATKKLSGAPLWQPAFDSQGRMFAGGAAFTPLAGQLIMVRDLAAQSTPTIRADAVLGDHYTQGITSVVDDHDNVAVADMNRGRVLIYVTPLASP